jgi:hypothetical protein
MAWAAKPNSAHQSNRVTNILQVGADRAAKINALYRKDPVFIAGYAFGVFVYLRNLYFVLRDRKTARLAA